MADFLRTNSLHADSLDGASRPVSRLKPVARARAGTCISLCTLLGLMSLMSALDRYSLEHKRPITLPLLREVLQSTLH